MTAMRAIGLSVRNFAGLRNGTYRFERSQGQAAQSVAIIGTRSAGKTTALQALLMAKELAAPYAQPPSLLARAHRPGHSVSLEAWFAVPGEAGISEQRVLFEQGGPEAIREVPPALASSLSRYEHGGSSFKVDYFPADRFLPSWPRATTRVRSALTERTLRVSTDPTKYASLWPWLADAIAKERVRRDAATQAAGFAFVDDADAVLKRLQVSMTKLDAGVRLAGLSAAGEPLFQTAGGSTVSADDLPGSARHALLLALSYEMVQHQRSLILVDEPERGCAQVDAAARFAGLVALGGDSQLIVATHLRAIAERADAVVEVAS